MNLMAKKLFESFKFKWSFLTDTWPFSLFVSASMLEATTGRSPRGRSLTQKFSASKAKDLVTAPCGGCGRVGYAARRCYLEGRVHNTQLSCVNQ